MRTAIVVVIALLLLPQAAMAVITFTQLDDDVFIVSHRVKVIGLRGKAQKLVYTKTASLCLAAGFSHMKVLHQESETGQADDAANASIRAQFYFEDGEDRVGCERNADQDYVSQARDKLARQGYRSPDPEAMKAEAAQSASGATQLGNSSCTLEQIAAMARSGLSDEQIRAACVG